MYCLNYNNIILIYDYDLTHKKQSIRLGITYFIFIINGQ